MLCSYQGTSIQGQKKEQKNVLSNTGLTAILIVLQSMYSIALIPLPMDVSASLANNQAL